MYIWIDLDHELRLRGRNCCKTVEEVLLCTIYLFSFHLLVENFATNDFSGLISGLARGRLNFSIAACHFLDIMLIKFFFSSRSSTSPSSSLQKKFSDLAFLPLHSVPRWIFVCASEMELALFVILARFWLFYIPSRNSPGAGTCSPGNGEATFRDCEESESRHELPRPLPRPPSRPHPSRKPFEKSFSCSLGELATIGDFSQASLLVPLYQSSSTVIGKWRSLVQLSVRVEVRDGLRWGGGGGQPRMGTG